jgi:NlpC/P60 family putative phage cell wall peptidase
MTSRTRIVAEARAFIGTPYRHQASLRGVGCDCLGLVRGVWRALHGTEPEAPPAYTSDWAEASDFEALVEAARRHLVELSDPRTFAPGDVLLFRYSARYPAKHAAIATATDLMVHAHDGARVAEVAIAPWWRRRLAFAFAFPGAN